MLVPEEVYCYNKLTNQYVKVIYEKKGGDVITNYEEIKKYLKDAFDEKYWEYIKILLSKEGA